MLGKKIKEECKTRAGKESEREGEREGFGQRKKKEKKIRVEKQMKEKKIGGEGNEENGQGGQCKRIEKLWDQSDNTWQKAIRGVYSYIVLAQGWQVRRGGGGERKESKRLNLAIFLICAFLVALPIYAAVLTNYSYLFSHCHIAGKIMGQTEQI